MKISAVICEYDPFHCGHEYMLGEMRRQGATHILAIMSGNFTQRGEPAMFDKYTRTRAALACGADLVAELPVSFACAGAQRFALGGAAIADGLGVVEELCFGSGSGEMSALTAAAVALSADEVQSGIRKYLQCGMTYAAAREKAVYDHIGEAAQVLHEPNDILATEYISALRSMGSEIKPAAVLRKGAPHGSDKPDGCFASASYIRSQLLSGNDIRNLLPKAAYDIFSKPEFPYPSGGRMKALEAAVLYRLRTMTIQELSALPDISEGLENRLYCAIRSSGSVEELISSVKTKRYTHARIRRIIMYALIGSQKQTLPAKPAYIRILGMNGRGREILSAAKGRASLPVVFRKGDISGNEAEKMFEQECRADDIFALSCAPAAPCGTNYTHKIVSS